MNAEDLSQFAILVGLIGAIGVIITWIVELIWGDK
jgi:quinol-cytochrome oxidoreductase complex cytochrome b subunit